MSEESEDLDAVLRLTWGCVIAAILFFAACVFIVAAAIKWVAA